MMIYEINPLSDSRWPEFTSSNGTSSIFHTANWLRALQKTYGYQPVAFTTSPVGQRLSNAIVCCEVRSWITGRRFVSLPFSDHCDPLVGTAEDYNLLLHHLQHLVGKGGTRYVELRPRAPLPFSFEYLAESDKYAFHAVDLRRSIDELNQSLHKDSIRRKIQRAQREGLTYDRGTSTDLLRKFYDLFVMTRKRHGVPPTPFTWFQNLVECLGPAAQIRLASKDGRPVAALFTLTHKKTVVYKYGASDAQFSNSGGTPYLFWMTITESKAEGFEELDLGRSDLDNEGLITFKERLGGLRSDLTYWRMSARPARGAVTSRPGFGLAQKVLAVAPNSVRIGLGNLLYKHLG